MRPRGAYKLSQRPRGFERGPAFDPFLLTRSDMRTQRVLESLRSEIVEHGGGDHLRIRQVFENPRAIYRLELELPELGYQRTTLLDRAALEELLAEDAVRAFVERSAPDGG